MTKYRDIAIYRFHARVFDTLATTWNVQKIVNSRLIVILLMAHAFLYKFQTKIIMMVSILLRKTAIYENLR